MSDSAVLSQAAANIYNSRVSISVITTSIAEGSVPQPWREISPPFSLPSLSPRVLDNYPRIHNMRPGIYKLGSSLVLVAASLSLRARLPTDPALPSSGAPAPSNPLTLPPAMPQRHISSISFANPRKGHFRCARQEIQARFRKLVWRERRAVHPGRPGRAASL